MFLLEYDGELMLHEALAHGDAHENAKQLAGMMLANEQVAKMVAGALPWYLHLSQGTSSVYAKAAMAEAIDEYDVYLEKVGGDV